MCSLSSGWKFHSHKPELKPTVNIRVYFQELLTCTEVTFSFGSSTEWGTFIYPKDHPSFVEVSCGRSNKDDSQSIEVPGLTQAMIYLYSRNQLGSAEANYVQFETRPAEPQDRWFQLVIPRYLDVILSGVIGSTFLEADPDYHQKPHLDVEIYPVLGPEQLGPPAVCLTHGMRLDPFQKCYRLSTRRNNKQFSFLFQTEFSLGYTHQSRCIGRRLKDTQKMREHATEPGRGQSTKSEKYAHDYYALTLYFRPWQLSASQVFQAGRDKETKTLGQDSKMLIGEGQKEKLHQYLQTCQKLVEQYEEQLEEMRLPTCHELDKFKSVVKELEERLKLDEQVKDVRENEQDKKPEREKIEILVDILKSWCRLTDLDGQRIKELFHLVEPDWDEMAILVAANDCMQKDSTHRRDVVLHTMERVLQKLQPYKDKLKYLLGCIRASNVFFVGKSKDAQDWLKWLPFHGGSLYSPSVEELMNHWKKDDIATLKRKRESQSKDGLDWVTCKLSNLLYEISLGALKKALVEMTPKRRKIVVITDGEISDLGDLQKNLEGYRKIRAIPGDGFKLFGGWDYKLLQMNAFLNDDQAPKNNEQSQKEKNQKELPPPKPKVDPNMLMQSCRRGAPLALDPTELADQICTYLKIVNNNLDIGGFGEQFEVLDILGKDASVQVGTRSENLWMAHLIVRVDERALNKPMKLYVTKEVKGLHTDKFNILSTKSKGELTKECSNMLWEAEKSSYFCWMAVEEEKLSNCFSQSTYAGSELIERAHLNLVARVLERDLLSRCAGKKTVEDKKIFFEQLGPATGTSMAWDKCHSKLSVYNELKQLELLPTLYEELVKTHISKTEKPKEKASKEFEDFDLIFREYRTQTRKSQNLDQLYCIDLFLQQLFFDLLHDIRKRVETIQKKCAGKFGKILPSLFEFIHVSSEMPRICLDQFHQANKRITSRNAIPVQVDSPVEKYYEDFDLLLPAPEAYCNVSVCYVEPFTQTHIALTLDTDIPMVWYRHHKHWEGVDEMTLLNPGDCLNDTIETPLEKHNRFFSRFYYRFRHTLHRILSEGLELAFERLLQTVSLNISEYSSEGSENFLQSLLGGYLKIPENSPVYQTLLAKEDSISKCNISETDSLPEKLKYLGIAASVVMQINRESIEGVGLNDGMFNHAEAEDFSYVLYDKLWSEGYPLEEILAVKAAFQFFVSWLACYLKEPSGLQHLPTADSGVLVDTLSFYIATFKLDYSEPLVIYYYHRKGNPQFEERAYLEFLNEYAAKHQESKFTKHEENYLFPEAFDKNLRSLGRGKHTSSKDYCQKQIVKQNELLRETLDQIFRKELEEALNKIPSELSAFDPKVGLDAKALENNLWHLMYGKYYMKAVPFLKTFPGGVERKNNELIVSYLPRTHETPTNRSFQLMVKYPCLLKLWPLKQKWKLEQEKREAEEALKLRQGNSSHSTAPTAQEKKWYQ